MATIEIPDADFDFSIYVKKNAKEFVKTFLSAGSINILARGYKGDIELQFNEIRKAIYQLNTINDKILFICELLNHLVKLKNPPPYITIPNGMYSSGSWISNEEPERRIDTEYIDVIQHLQYFLYKLASEVGFSLDQNQFTIDETIFLSDKIDEIIIALENLKLGQYALGDEIQELKDNLKEEFDALKSDFPLGKKRWYQRLAGIITTYAGNKVADDFIWEHLKPYIKQLFHDMPKLLDKL